MTVARKRDSFFEVGITPHMVERIPTTMRTKQLTLDNGKVIRAAYRKVIAVEPTAKPKPVKLVVVITTPHELRPKWLEWSKAIGGEWQPAPRS